jgi:mono/diheme cytochrome c family protein
MTRRSKTGRMWALLFAGAAAHGPAGAHDPMSHDHAVDAVKEHWEAPQAAAKRRNPVPPNGTSIEQGRQLFEANCVACHGPVGRGDGPAAPLLDPKPADLAMMAGHHPDGDLAWKIANGRDPMPAWKGTLSEKQIWTLVTYIKSLPAADAQRQDDGRHHQMHDMR